jgi:hypothetical protein
MLYLTEWLTPFGGQVGSGGAGETLTIFGPFWQNALTWSGRTAVRLEPVLARFIIAHLFCGHKVVEDIR